MAKDPVIRARKYSNRRGATSVQLVLPEDVARKFVRGDKATLQAAIAAVKTELPAAKKSTNDEE